MSTPTDDPAQYLGDLPMQDCCFPHQAACAWGEAKMRAYALDAVQRALAAQQPRWVSVTERMPPKCVEVLIAFRDSPLPATGQYTASDHDTWGWCFPSENDPDETGPITHWMPLPEPPTPQEPHK